MKKLYLAVCLICSAFTINAQVLAWDFNGALGNEASVSPLITDPNLQPTAITRGSVTPSALANAFNSSGWSTSNTLAGAITDNSYYQITVQAKAGYTVSLAGINANFRRTGSGPKNFQWMYSLDGTTFTAVGSMITYTGTSTNGTAQAPIDLQSSGALEDIPSSTTITLRLYAYNASSASGDFALGRLFGNDLSITGTVTPLVIPIKLISFNATNNKTSTKFQWLVNCTSTSVTFELLRGKTVADMQSIYRKNETQQRCASAFYFTDTETPETQTMYRLKMIDIDGKASYSSIITISSKHASQDQVSVFPTIVTTDATIAIPAKTKGMANISIVDVNGKRLRSIDAEIYPGNNIISLPTSAIAAGMYHVQVVMPDNTKQTAVLIKK